MADRNKELLACVKARGDTAWNACAAVWDLIQAQPPEEGERYFAAFLSRIFAEDIFSKDADAFLPDESVAVIKEKVGDMGKRIMLNLVKKRLPEEEFYRDLWNKIGDTALLPDREAQIAFLVYLWMNAYIPYYQIGPGCTMQEDEFARRKAEIWPVLRRAFFVLAFPLEQRTQRTSLLMELAKELRDEQDQAVYWACVFKRIQDRAGRK